VRVPGTCEAAHLVLSRGEGARCPRGSAEDVMIPESIQLSAASLTTVAVIVVVALVSVAMALRFRSEVLRACTGTESMNAIAGATQEGAEAYLRRPLLTLGGFAATAVVLLLLLPIHGDPQLPEWLLRFSRSVAFLVGAAFSALIGYLGMWLAVRANLRVAAAARGGRPGSGHDHRGPYRSLRRYGHDRLRSAGGR